MTSHTNSELESDIGSLSDIADVEPSFTIEPTVSASDHEARIEAAKVKAEQFIANRQYPEAKAALAEVDKLQDMASRMPQADAARAKAATLLAEGRHADAIKALEEAEALEAGPGKAEKWSKDVKTGILAQVHKIKRTIKTEKGSAEAAAAATVDAPVLTLTPVDDSMRIVKLYSKIAAAVGLLPGGILNFAAVFAVQILMVWRISRTFGHTESKENVRGAVMSLISSVVPAGIGHTAGAVVAAIPAALAGAAVYFIATPVLAYAMTQAVGKVFIMHFESGSTLLSFDPKAFGEKFLHEFRTAGGTVKSELAPEPLPV